MSEPFLTTTIDDMRISVEVAWGADLTDLDGSSWTWSDITADVVLGSEGAQSSGITITIGRPDFSSETQTAIMTCQLDNRDAAYSEGGMSANWPNVRRGTPVRVRVSDDDGATWSLRFQGSANGFTPQWDAETGRWATVELSASGPLRRLNQGTGLLLSAMREGTLADPSVVAYVPMEDQQNATFVAPAVGDARGLWRVVLQDPVRNVAGSPGECASFADIPSSAPIVTFGEGGGMIWDIPNGLTTTAATFTGFYANSPSLVPWFPEENRSKFGGPTTPMMFVIRTDGANIKAWSLVAVGSGVWLSAYDTDPFNYGEAQVINSGTLTFELLDSTPYEFGLSLSQSGSTTNFRLFRRQLGTSDTKVFTGSIGSNSNGARVTEIRSATLGDSGGLVAGHFVLRNTIVNENYDRNWSDGYPGETVPARLERLCETHGINLDLLDSSVAQSGVSVTESMGPQFYATLTELLRECEMTGQGLLYDGVGPGLTYVTKRRRAANANGTATLTIDASAAQMMEPFAPIDDDQVTINHVDATRRSGTVASYMDVTGPMGVEAIGDYATSLSVNPETDEGLNHFAEWMVGIGTQEGYRYPTVSFALEVNPELVNGWLACLPQSRIDVTNVATIRRQHPDETIKLLLEGWQETIDAFTWRVTANTSSAVPWNVVKLAAATGSTGDGICHMDTDGSQLNANAAAGDTSISVRSLGTTAPLWVTTSADADSFPFDLDVGGCKVTVTGIGAAVSRVQAFTLSTPLPRAFTGSSTAGAGTPVKVWRPPVFGL